MEFNPYVGYALQLTQFVMAGAAVFLAIQVGELLWALYVTVSYMHFQRVLDGSRYRGLAFLKLWLSFRGYRNGSRTYQTRTSYWRGPNDWFVETTPPAS